jgi:hypothetical protein
MKTLEACGNLWNLFFKFWTIIYEISFNVKHVLLLDHIKVAQSKV